MFFNTIDCVIASDNDIHLGKLVFAVAKSMYEVECIETLHAKVVWKFQMRYSTRSCYPP
jgi:hypothetical protein